MVNAMMNRSKLGIQGGFGNKLVRTLFLVWDTSGFKLKTHVG